jgi:hypothetical protein
LLCDVVRGTESHTKSHLRFGANKKIGADYTSDFFFDFMSDLLHIAGAIWCICDLLSDKNHFLSFFLSKSQMRFGVRFRVRCRCAPQIAQQIAWNV